MTNSQAHIFFTLNDFSTQDGGPVRMYGLLNALANDGNHVVFYSNTTDYHNFHPAIEHRFVNKKISAKDKRKFQFFLALGLIPILDSVFKDLKEHLHHLLSSHQNDTVYFFEYLDNSIGYWLYKNKIIGNYVNDIHGIAPLEFSYQKENKGNLQYLKFQLKESVAEKLDKKVLGNALFNIHASERMYDYFCEKYPAILHQKKVVIPNLLSENSFNKKINLALAEQIKQKYIITENDFIILFAGSFKLTGGVLDLIKAFEILSPTKPKAKLMLIGDGPEKAYCEKYVQQKGLNDKVIFTGKTPYGDLPIYQSLAKIIVCPDQDNPYSHLIIHLKYLDSLLSNKIVINGDFESVHQINEDEKLSLYFEPSNVEDLAKVISKAIDNNDFYLEKYRNNSTYALENLTYSQFMDKNHIAL